MKAESILHLEMVMGTASAGPIAVEEARLTAMVSRALGAAEGVVH